jgi:hypothetical protein
MFRRSSQIRRQIPRQIPSTTSRLTPLIAAFAACAFSATARADGAFPDTQSVLLPSDLPRTIVVGTNFGLVVSADDGATWQYSCENTTTSGGRIYSMGPASDDRVFAISVHGAVVSPDLGCSWSIGSGFDAEDAVLDLFASPGDPAQVLALAFITTATGNLYSLYHSGDGGVSYQKLSPPMAANSQLTGVEISRADPLTWYITLYDVDPTTRHAAPRLLRTADAGATWQSIDLQPSLGAHTVYIAAVGRSDPRMLFLRVVGSDDQGKPFDEIAVSRDGGETMVNVLTVSSASFTAFLERASGIILVTGWMSEQGGAGAPLGFRSQDAGNTFDAWDPKVHVRGLAERGATLFAAANDALPNEFALGSTDDEGAHWEPRLHFAQIGAVRSCSAAECMGDCYVQVAVKLFPENVCTGKPTPPPAPASNDGCSCDLPGQHAREREHLWLVAPLLAWVVYRRRR